MFYLKGGQGVFGGVGYIWRVPGMVSWGASGRCLVFWRFLARYIIGLGCGLGCLGYVLGFVGDNHDYRDDADDLDEEPQGEGGKSACGGI